MRRVGQLHFLTDARVQTPRSHRDLAQLALEGGADVIQLREKKASTRALIALGRELNALCRAAGATFIVNDRIDVALAVDAAGVHLGQDDFPISLARRLLGPDRLIGGSATTLAQAQVVAAAGADYVGFGAIYPTMSKADASSPRGLGDLREVVAQVEIPVIAIGGIDLARAPAVFATGAHGFAVIQAIAGADDPRAATAALKAVIEAGR